MAPQLEWDAAGGNRTHKPLRAPGLESGASANSATAAGEDRSLGPRWVTVGRRLVLLGVVLAGLVLLPLGDLDLDAPRL